MVIFMVPNDEVVQKKEELRDKIDLASDLIKHLQKFTDATKYDPIIRKPTIDKIFDLCKDITEYTEKLVKLDKKLIM